MSFDTGAGLIWGTGALILVASSLAVRSISPRQTVKMALLWIGIFALAYGGFLFRNDASDLWGRVQADLSGDAGQRSGTALRVQKSEDGQFWVEAMLNDKRVRFLVDSGATVTTISPETANLAGIEPMAGPAIIVETANGAALAHPARARHLSLGPIVHLDERVQISEQPGSADVLGMSFLEALKSWHVERGALTLQP